MVSRSSTPSEGFDALDGFLVHYDRRAARSLRPRLRARLLARLRGASLDAALISGQDPAQSEALAARATLLTSRRSRASIAAGLERALRAADAPQRRWWAVSAHSPLLGNAAAVRELAVILSSERPVYAAGIATITQILTDGTGAAYRGHPDALAGRLREARAALVD